MAAAGDAAGDGGNLGRSLAQAEDDLGKSLAQVTMAVDAGKAQIVERRRAHRVEHPAGGVVGAGAAGPNLVKQGVQLLFGHASKKRSRGALAL